MRGPVTFAALLWIVPHVPGCAHVPPYERERLAHPSMVTSDPARSSEQHMRSVQEGAIGGGATAGGGCGCN
jgi:hypothetical protein